MKAPLMALALLCAGHCYASEKKGEEEIYPPPVKKEILIGALQCKSLLQLRWLMQTAMHGGSYDSSTEYLKLAGLGGNYFCRTVILDWRWKKLYKMRIVQRYERIEVIPNRLVDMVIVSVTKGKKVRYIAIGKIRALGNTI